MGPGGCSLITFSVIEGKLSTGKRTSCSLFHHRSLSELDFRRCINIALKRGMSDVKVVYVRPHIACPKPLGEFVLNLLCKNVY